jgi:acyl-CoA thioesterase FadM
MNKYVHHYCITGADIDIEYRIHHNAVIAFFQDCVANYYTSKKLAAFDIIHDDLMWVIFDFNVEFLNEMPFWTEHIKVEVWMSEITKLRFYVDFKLYTSDNKVFAQGNSCWNIIHIKTKKLVTTDQILSKFELCNELALGAHKKTLFDTGKDKIATYKHKINFTDLDFNRHVSNRNYLTIASATSPVDYLALHTMKTLSVKFLRESFLHDVLNCELHRSAEHPEGHSARYVHTIKRESDQSEICLISTSWENKKPSRSILEYMAESRPINSNS